MKRAGTLRRTGGPRRRSRLAARSDKRIALQYGDFVALRLERSSRCEVGPMIDAVEPWHRCEGRATGLHHLRKRSAGGRIKSRLNTLRSCDTCNSWVEDHPLLAEIAGLAIRPGHPKWPWLGERLPSGRSL